MAKKSANDDRRIWLDWSKPALAATVEWLLDRYCTGRVWDLSKIILVTPGSRSRHRLLELLVRRAELDGLRLIPPRFVAIAHLPETLYDPTGNFASETIQLLGWCRALRGVGAERLGVIAKGIPKSNSVHDWMPLAKLLLALHSDLAGEALTFANVLQTLTRMQVDRSELDRWKLLAELQEAYYQQLKGVELRDQHEARSTAIQRKECRTAQDIVLVGVVDLSRAFQAMLRQVSDRVHSLVFASDDVRDGFDELGCLISDFWKTQPIELQQDNIRIVDRPAEQASAVINSLAELHGQFPANQIAIGVPDRSIISHLRRALDLAGVQTRDVAGKPLSQSLPFRLLEVVADYLRHPQFAQYSRLVRHPDCFDWISTRIENRGWLGCVDKYQNEFIPGAFTLADGFRAPNTSILHGIHRAVSELLRPLFGSERRIEGWVEPWMNLLLAIYGGRELDNESTTSREVFSACRAIQAALGSLADLPKNWSPECSAEMAMDMALAQIEREVVVEPVALNAIELLGWLDLPLDDADVTIVTGMNEGIVPSSEHAHQFLPNSVCAQLGIEDNDRRLARDAYALSFIARSGRKLHLICGRRSGAGDPQLPSRLLFATDDQTAAERANAFFHHRAEATSRIWLAKQSTHHSKQQFPIPVPVIESLALSSLRVTDFKQYLQCPYRFYLGRVLRLEPCVDNFAELPAFAFGILLHDVVKSFGNDPVKDSTDPDEIRNYFRRRLDLAIERFGENPSAAVRIQYQQVRLRLDRLAELQARRRRDGWQIIEAEVPRVEARWVVDGEPFSIRGQVDRVDRNVNSGRLAVFDYKTRDSVQSPEQAHRRQGKWVDLQLPLYRHLIQTREYYSEGPMELGYILVPGDAKKMEFAIASWSEEELRAADEIAYDVIRKVRRNEFWPPIDPPPEYSELWSAICQDEISERWSATEEVL